MECSSNRFAEVVVVAMFGKLEYMGDNKFLCSFNSPLWGIQPAPFTIKDGKVQSITISVSENVDMMAYEFEKIQ